MQQPSDAKNMLRNFNCLQDFRPAYIMFSLLGAILSICNQMSLGNCRWPELEKKIHAEWHPCIGWKNQLAAKRISAWCKGAEMVKSESEDGHSNHGLSSDIKFISITLIDFKYSQLDSYSERISQKWYQLFIHEKLKNLIIFSPAFYPIICLMKSPKNFEKIAILKI